LKTAETGGQNRYENHGTKRLLERFAFFFQRGATLFNF
jgi:hypothetical protein